MTAMQRLELRQGQVLAMTPQLVQSIKLLQLSHLELSAYVEAELERNPLLQAAEAASEAPAPTLADFLNAKQRHSAAPPRPIPGPAPASKSSASGSGSVPHAELKPELEATLARTTSLAEHLAAQLDLATADPDLRAIGSHLIHELDEAGYLREPLPEIAERLGVDLSLVEAALGLIQSLDPPGVGARHLAECLAIQLRERNRLDPAMETLLAHLPLVARQDFAALRRLCGVDTEDLADMLAEIRRLEPKPGLAFAPARTEVLVADVSVRAHPDGSFSVELNPDTQPRLLLNRAYYAQVSKLVRKDEDKRFLSSCLQSANWLTRSLDQRARTILTVAGEIVRRQEGFFREGLPALRPLTLKDVAQAIGMHESTVSRVVANKAIGTASGTVPMKFFFSAAAGENGHSAKAVRHRIKQLIEAERPGAVLSDEAIAQKLISEGIAIARRTVAKYRESLRIPPSAMRRRRRSSKQVGE